MGAESKTGTGVEAGTGTRTGMEMGGEGSPGIHHISTIKRNITCERGVGAYGLPVVSAGKPDA